MSKEEEDKPATESSSHLTNRSFQNYYFSFSQVKEQFSSPLLFATPPKPNEVFSLPGKRRMERAVGQQHHLPSWPQWKMSLHHQENHTFSNPQQSLAQPTSDITETLCPSAQQPNVTSDQTEPHFPPLLSEKINTSQQSGSKYPRN